MPRFEWSTPDDPHPSVVAALSSMAATLREVQAAILGHRGPINRAQGLSLLSAASKELRLDEESAWGSGEVPAPVRDILGHAERLVRSCDDLTLGLATILDGPAPSWFAHLPIARALFENAGRLWALMHPSLSGRERVAMLLTERLVEIGYWKQHANSGLRGLDAVDHNQDLTPDFDSATDAIAADSDTKTAKILQWAEDNGYEVGPKARTKWVGKPREGITRIVGRLIDETLPGVDVGLAAATLAYHNLSALDHGLYDGVGYYAQHAELLKDGQGIKMSLGPQSIYDQINYSVMAYIEAQRLVDLYFRWEGQRQVLSCHLLWNHAMP